MEDGGSLQLLGTVLTVVLLFALLRPVLFFFLLLKSQFRRPTIELAQAEDIGADVREYLLEGAAALFALGFEQLGWVKLRSVEESQHGDSFALLLLHPASAAHARVTVDQMGAGVKINFSAELADGQWMETVHGESAMLVGVYPDTEVVDSASPEMTELWRVFAERLAQRASLSPALPHGADACVAARTRWTDRWFDLWCQQGVLQRSRAGDCFEIGLAQAARLAWRFNRAAGAYAQLQMARAKLKPPPAPISEQITAYRRVREIAERRGTRWRVGSVLIVTALLFALSMLRIMDPATMIATVVVVMFHELGHYTAMRLLGYRDTSIFFIPFFGAAARGVKPDARPHEQLVVLLAGPLPGIVLAVVLAALFPDALRQPHVRTFVDLLLIINLLNLFPIFPLDGGRVLQVICANAGPWLEVAIRLLGALALGAMGALAGDAVLMTLSIVLLAAIPAARRSAAAVKRIRALGAIPEQEDARLQLLFEELHHNQPSLPPPRRFAVVLPVAERLRQGSLSLLGSLSWGGAYFFCIVGGVVAFAFVSVFADGSVPPLFDEKTTPLACSELGSLRSQLKTEPGSFSLKCALEDDQRAESLRDGLQSFFSFPWTGCLRAPWHGTLGRSAETLAGEERARHTISALHREARREMERLYPRRGGKATVALPDQPYAQIRAAQQRLIAARGGDPTFDADLALTWLALHEEADASAESDESAGSDEGSDLVSSAPDLRWEAMLDRLGRREPTCSETDRRATTTTLPDLGELHLFGYREDLRAGMFELASYLCEQGCGLSYSVRPQRRHAGRQPEQRQRR